MRNRFLTGVTMVAVLASAPAPIPLAMAHSVPAPGQGFCRNAAPLPQLDPEVRPQPQQVNGSITTRGSEKRDREEAMAVEPPYPAPRCGRSLGRGPARYAPWRAGSE
ncbi:MAG: hypothetical protein EOP63_05395, partial [Sphingomonadales bacterium]